MENEFCEGFVVVEESLGFVFVDIYISVIFGGVFVSYEEFDVLEVFIDYVIDSEGYYKVLEVFVDFIDVLVEFYYFVERLMLFLVVGSFVIIESLELVIVYEDFI